MKKSNNIWLGITDKNNDPKFEEVTGGELLGLPIEKTITDEQMLDRMKTDRRDFLKYLGFGLGAATIAASCDAPVKKAIPYAKKPDTIVPGVPTYYASSIVNGGDYCSVLVKTREGRPIKIEGNVLSSITAGGTSARAQASVLSLYNKNRLHGPGKVDGTSVTEMSWADLDKAITGQLTASSRIRIVTNTEMSPTTKQIFQDFHTKYPMTKLVTYDAISSSAILEANQATFGQQVIPDYHFDHADMIVSFGADFLGTWISPIEYTRQFVKNRKVDRAEGAKMSRLVCVESGMSLTGSNADNRIQIKPSEQGAAIAGLLSALGGGVSGPSFGAKSAIGKLANELKAHQGKCLVVSNSNNVGEQILVNKINDILGSYGNTIDFGAVSYQRQGIDRQIQEMIMDMQSGAVDAVFFWNANPSYDLPNSDRFREALSKVKLRVSLNGSMNETTADCQYVAPKHHNLEAWGDVEPKRGHYSLIQPTIAPLYNTRQGEESFMAWAGMPMTAEQPYYEYLKAAWKNRFMPEASGFRSFWDEKLANGVFEVAQDPVTYEFGADVPSAALKINKPSGSEMELSLVETVNIGAGNYGENPWLQEMPDPITRTVWGNYLMVPIEWDGDWQFEGYKGTGSQTVFGIADKLDVKVGGGEATTLVTVPQFGQAKGSVSLALGYGRTVVNEVGKNVGINTFPWATMDANGNTQYYNTKVEISDIVGQQKDFACVQYHHTMGVKGEGEQKDINLDEIAVGYVKKGYQGAFVDRSIIYQSNLKEIGELEKKIGEFREMAHERNEQTMYPFEEYSENLYSQGHHWGMHIDMNACTGCGACTVACMAENNVPVVGRYEVSRHHEMTWLKIDRYYYGDAENPNVVFQPVMCQHCDNAPCENVCPVNATNHSSEGLNQMVYNRCIGTRYCANNCPYKVRRFNWLDYTSADSFRDNQQNSVGEDPMFYNDNVVRMVLNPDVTVRSRGVIEKCSFCVQRLQDGKLKAKIEGRKLEDKDVRVACQTACPGGAITFGDQNIKDGELNQKLESPLNYRLLEEINVQSSVYYQAKVNNRSEDLDA